MEFENNLTLEDATEPPRIVPVMAIPVFEEFPDDPDDESLTHFYGSNNHT